jgi:hypothetical protein
MRDRLAAIPLAAVAILALASVAFAGGWAQVTVKDAPIDPPAGGGTPIEMTVLQHGVTAVSWPGLTVVATDSTSGAVVRTAAQAKGPTGTYLATIVFPNAGDWTLTFESPDLEMAGTVAMSVAPTVVALPAAAAPATATVDYLPLVLIVAAALLLGISSLALTGRARDARVPVTN